MKSSRLEPAAARALGKLLTFGVLTGAALMAVGAVLAANRGGLARGLGLGTKGFAIRGLFSMDTEAVLRAGVLVLILTPIVRVVAVAVMLARRQDRAGLVYSVAVLLLVALATALEVRR